jgi:hypothetical protein
MDTEVDENGKQFLIQLFEQTNGESSVQVSMYDIGEQLGMDRDAASKIAQDLIGEQLVEIRTLSGGIGISEDGSTLVQKLIGATAPSFDNPTKLGDALVLNSVGRQAIIQISADLKNQAGALGLNFDSLTELTADLQTIDAQMASSRPKTAIFKECLRSIKTALANSETGKDMSGRINALLDD